MDDAIEFEQTEVQALLMMLLFDKQVVALEDSVSKLRVFFLDKHQKRMSEELSNYIEKMGIQRERPSCYKVYTDKNNLYVYARDKLQAKTYTMKHNPLKIEYVPSSELMTVENTEITINELVKGRRVPSLIGEEMK